MDYDVIKYVSMIQNEYYKAQKKFPLFNSTHEGYAVLKEEVDELWDAIKRNESEERLIEEAVQVGAMAIKFLKSCCTNKALKQTEGLSCSPSAAHFYVINKGEKI